jgi:tripartite-type tricarboxylate transporter receptor subunit TctC
MSEKRMSSFPNIQSTGEIGLNSYVGTWRGLYARSSTPQAAIDSITKALEKVWNMPAYQDFLRQASYLDRPGFADGTEFQKLMNAEYVIFEDYLKTIGIIK